MALRRGRRISDMDTTVEQLSSGTFRVSGKNPIRAFRRRAIRARGSLFVARALRTPINVLGMTTLGTGALIGLFMLINGRQESSSENVSPAQVLRSLSISQNHHSPRETMLARVNQEQEHRIASQIHFISELILSHRSKSISISTPQAYALSSLIVSESIRAGFDPLLIAAIIKSESTFNPNARSTAGALGLMQMLPSTGTFIANVAGFHQAERESLHDPAYNLKLGIYYLEYLRKNFKGNYEHMLIAYNWGPENVRKTLRDGRRAPSSTIKYAQKVLGHYQGWSDNFDAQAQRYRHFDFERAAVGSDIVKNIG